MSGRNRRDPKRPGQAKNQGSRPNSAHASGRSTPDPRSQSTINPQFSDLSITDPRFNNQPTPDQQRITGPHRSQRSHTPQPTPYPSFTRPATPSQLGITDPYGGQPIFQGTSGGHPGSYYGSQPTVYSRFGDQSTIDSRFSGQTTPYQQHFTDPYRSQSLYETTSSGQRFPVPQPTPYPSFTHPATSNEQHITDPYGGQPIFQGTSGGHPGSYYGSQPTVYSRFGDQSTIDSRFSGQTTPYQQHFTDPYGGHRFPVPQPPAYPSFSGQPTPNQQRISGPYAGQPILETTSGDHHGPYSSTQPTVYPHFGDQSITDPRYIRQTTPNQRRIVDPYPDGQSVLEATSGSHPVPRSSGQPINDGIYTIANVYQKRFIYLEDANDKTPLRGHYNPEHHGARWRLKRWVGGEYSIQNVDNGRYANCESRAQLDAFVEGHGDEQIWRIQERYEGQYMIAAIDSGNLWMLPDKEKYTPVTFSKARSDPMCLWSFESAEIVAPVNENLITLPFVPNTGLSSAPSGGQPVPEAAIVEFTSVIVGARDLLPPLRLACGALRVVIQGAENIGHVTWDRKVLINRFKLQLATVENDIAKLEEDQNIDKIIPALNQDVRESLEAYARELKETCELLSDNRPKDSSLVGELTGKTGKIDEVFQIYTAALHRFAASTVDQMRQQLGQFQQESENAHTVAQKARPIRPNAYGIQHRECLQGTREKTLRAISDWVDNENAENWILFFLDVAGSGKSTVAKHMAEKWEQEGRLLARFFFSRDTTETMSTNLFCSTVAGAFAALDPTYQEHMDKFMKVPNVELLPFKKRFEGLVVGPLRAIGRHAILIIDALDECHPEQREQLLQTLRDQHSSIPFLRIIATGRPERDIKLWAEEKFNFGYTNFIRLEKSDKDVELYIKHTLKGLPIVQDRLYPVIRHAEGLFIWARIACDLLLDSDDIDGLLEELGREVSLDYLYKVALEQSMPKEGASRRAMVLVLQMILAAREPLSIAELEALSPKRGVVEKVVTRLSSVLLYKGRKDPIRLLHATFREFLITQSKAGVFFIQVELGHHTLALGCLTTISNQSLQGDPTLQALDAISQRKEVSFEQDTR